MSRVCVHVALVVGALFWSGVARADVQDWQLNEVLTTVGGDATVQYIELRNDVGGCFFPTSRIEVFDAAGGFVGAVNAAVVTTCFDPGLLTQHAHSGELF